MVIDVSCELWRLEELVEHTQIENPFRWRRHLLAVFRGVCAQASMG
jgi:hypothetical protein